VLGAMAKAGFELIQPPRQSPQQCNRVPIEHWVAAYANRSICTMTSKVITLEFTTQFNDLTKSY
jgi:hypothetical protein